MSVEGFQTDTLSHLIQAKVDDDEFSFPTGLYEEERGIKLTTAAANDMLARFDVPSDRLVQKGFV